MQNTQQTIKQLIEENKTGFTASMRGELQNFKRGYAVSITNNFNKDLNALIKNIFVEHAKVKSVYRLLYLGGWFDNQSAVYYLDLSLIISNRKTALKFARLYNQKAIFNFKSMQEIRL